MSTNLLIKVNIIKLISNFQAQWEYSGFLQTFSWYLKLSHPGIDLSLVLDTFLIKANDCPEEKFMQNNEKFPCTLFSILYVYVWEKSSQSDPWGCRLPKRLIGRKILLSQNFFLLKLEILVPCQKDGEFLWTWKWL